MPRNNKRNVKSEQENSIKATFDAFENLFDAKKVAANRGKSLKEMWG